MCYPRNDTCELTLNKMSGAVCPPLKIMPIGDPGVSISLLIGGEARVLQWEDAAQEISLPLSAKREGMEQTVPLRLCPRRHNRQSAAMRKSNTLEPPLRSGRFSPMSLFRKEGRSMTTALPMTLGPLVAPLRGRKRQEEGHTEADRKTTVVVLFASPPPKACVPSRRPSLKSEP